MKRFFAYLAILLVICMMMSSCGGAPVDTEAQTAADTQEKSEKRKKPRRI